jgi:endonuclease YncB( thermonuclease family)
VYEYRVIVTGQHDGDTFRGDIDTNEVTHELPAKLDLGFNLVWRREKGEGYRLWFTDRPFRLNRINAPEVTGEQKPLGLKSKEYVNKSLPIGAEIWVRTVKDKTEKYGRYLADIYPKGFTGPCLNDSIVADGFGKFWDGQGARPV